MNRREFIELSAALGDPGMGAGRGARIEPVVVGTARAVSAGRRVRVSPRWSSLGANLLWISFYVLQTGLTLGATQADDSAAGRSALQMVAMALNVSSSILMSVVAIALLVAFRPSAVLQPADAPR